MSLFRQSRDGRSIGLALAVLLLVNALFAGLSAGIAAPAEAVFCASPSAHGAGAPGLPSAHDHDCCVRAFSAAAPVVPPAFFAPTAPVSTVRFLLPEADIRPNAVLLAREPRGPPLI